MSEEALKDAKLLALESQNQQLLLTIEVWSAQLKAKSQCCNELFEANLHLRTNYYIQEEKLASLNQGNNSLLERLAVLENEKAALLRDKADLENKIAGKRPRKKK